MTEVLDLQRDAILIVNVGQDTIEPDSPDTSLSIEFSNVKSKELFGINLAASFASVDSEVKANALDRLSLPQFVP